MVENEIARERAGASFEDADVVENYPFRPPYPDTVFEKLLGLGAGRAHLLDIGCGPGKVSRPLATHFERVTAVDPSRHMIALGQSLEGGDAPNIRWIEGFAEDFPIGEERFDLTVAAASIHWMDHARLFPRLAAYAAPGHRMAVISGDTPLEPAWEEEWQGFLARWVPRITGEAFDPIGKQEKWAGYRNHLDVEGSTQFVSAPFEQSLTDFIRCQHSRDTFAPSKLGNRMALFDAELAELLAPYADEDGGLSYVVGTKVVWGTIIPR